VLFIGNETFSTDELVPYMRTRESGSLSLVRYQWNVLLEDLGNLERFYASQGFLTAEVALDDIGLSPDSTRVDLLIGVREGDRWTVEEHSFRGNEILSGDELGELTANEQGGPFLVGRLASDKRAILTAYARRSYLDARVDQVADRDDLARSASISYSISEGHEAVIDSVWITGNEKTRGFVIERELAFEPGELFDSEKVGESQAELYRTGLFNSVWIEPDPADTGRAHKDVIVRVSERPSGDVDFTLGYAVIDGAEVGAGITNRNVQGQATSLRLEGRLSERSRSARASAGDPWFLGRRVAAEMSSYYEWSDEASYLAEQAGAAFVLTRDISRNVVLEGGYGFERTSVLDAAEDEDIERNYTSDLTFGVTYDTRDDVLSASRGMFAHGEVDFASSRLGGTNDFVRTELDWRGYVRVRRGRIASLQLRLGWLKPQEGSEEVPVNERFLTGGEGSVRGFPRNSLGPTDEDGTPIGGRALLAGRAEYRFPLYGTVRAAVFVDAGQVYEELASIRPSRLAVGGGLGVRYETRIGVLRVDVATPLSERGEPHYYFGIGQAF
jgi:outer membrane protein insertion porin family